MLIAVRPMLGQRWRDDPPIQEWEFAWLGGVALGALAAAATRGESAQLRGISVGSGITVGVGFGISLGHQLDNRPGEGSVIWPMIGAGLVALPLTMTSDCGTRRGADCTWEVLLTPALSALGALIAHQLSQR
jgi:hypothetical protein